MSFNFWKAALVHFPEKLKICLGFPQAYVLGIISRLQSSKKASKSAVSIPLRNLQTNLSPYSGTFYCLVSALAYTASSVCMRQLTALGCDPLWAVFNRELVAVVVMGFWLAGQVLFGRKKVFPAGNTFWLLLLVGLWTEVVANVGLQWSLGVIGLAVAIPLSCSTMILGGAAIGRFWLGERVSARSAAAIALLLLSLLLLGKGAAVSSRLIVGESAGKLILKFAVPAIGLTVLAGVIYALLSSIIRHSLKQGLRPPFVAFFVPFMAIVGLGPICLARFGLATLLATPVEQLLPMAGAGVSNLIGFLAWIGGLQRTTVVHANLVVTSEVAMVALAGILIFGEPVNFWLILGIGLTSLGILAIDQPREAAEEIIPP